MTIQSHSTTSSAVIPVPAAVGARSMYASRNTVSPAVWSRKVAQPNQSSVVVMTPGQPSHLQLGGAGWSVSEEREAVTDGRGLDETHRGLVTRLAEEALARTEHDREDDQPDLIDQVVLHQRAPELITGRNDDLSVQLALQFRDLVHDIAREDPRVVPVGIHE